MEAAHNPVARARPNELAALKWGDIDWQRSAFRIRAGRYRGHEGAPKTASSIRDIPNRTRRNGSAFAARMEIRRQVGAQGLPQVVKTAESVLDREA